MKKILLFSIAALIAAGSLAACTERPEKREPIKPTFNFENDEADNTESETEVVSDSDVENDAGTIADKENETEAVADTGEDVDVVDTHVYSGDELTIETVTDKIIGYWEFDNFGYIGGYRFYENGFLQLTYNREVAQTGIYKVTEEGVYFSTDKLTWDEDIMVITSMSDAELVVSFNGKNLVLYGKDESLVIANADDEEYVPGKDYGGLIDAANEVEEKVKVN